MGRFRIPIKATVLTTLLHFVALLSASCRHWLYLGVVTLSVTNSVAWHWLNEPPGLLMWADYSFAAIWAALDLALCPTSDAFALTLLVFLANHLTDKLAASGVASYTVLHSLWHVLSTVKAVYISLNTVC